MPRFDAGAPVRLVDAAARPRFGARLRQVAAGTIVSALVHVGLAVAFLIVWRAMVRNLTAPEPISVELVRSVPDVKSKPEAAGPKPPEPEKAAPILPAPVPPAPAPAPPAAADPGAHVGEPPRSALVEPPPEPRQAATQVAPDPHPTVADEKARPVAPPPAAGPQVPTVLAAPAADTSVPAPPPPAAPPAARSVDADPSPRPASATLASALPSMALALPSSFQAILSSAGSAESRQYKGVVYGMLGRGRARAVAEDAERRGLKGQVIVALTIDDGGAVDRIGVVQSSGRDDVDQAAVALVRAAAPFPPPPAGTEHSFTPAIAFGERE